MEPRISIITLGVADLKSATNFYQNGLGLPLQENSNEQISFFSLKGTWLALFSKKDLAKDANAELIKDEGFCGVTLAHNVQTKQLVDELLEQAEKQGAKITKVATETDWGGYSGYFQDLDGYYWEVAYNPHFWI